LQIFFVDVVLLLLLLLLLLCNSRGERRDKL
jgi:hypothetical protein